jgi:hypothetical protein
MKIPARVIAVSLAAFCASVAPLGPGARGAGLELTWNACGASGGDSTITFDCAQTDSVARLIGCFKLPQRLPRFFAMDIVVDVRTETNQLPPFWHFENVTGCNNGGVTVSDRMPSSGCAGVANPWGPGGRSADALITAYGAHHGDDLNHGRFLFTIARAASDTIDLEANKSYFGFEIRFFNDGAKESGGKCVGCDAKASILWSTARLYSASPFAGGKEPPPVTLSGPGRFSDSVHLNGGGISSSHALRVRQAFYDAVRDTSP